MAKEYAIAQKCKKEAERTSRKMGTLRLTFIRLPEDVTSVTEEEAEEGKELTAFPSEEDYVCRCCKIDPLWDIERAMTMTTVTTMTKAGEMGCAL
jgi:hypothetical protein